MGIREAPGVPRAPGATRELRGDTGDTGIAGRHARDAIVGRVFSSGLFCFDFLFLAVVFSCSLFQNLKLFVFSHELRKTQRNVI